MRSSKQSSLIVVTRRETAIAALALAASTSRDLRTAVDSVD